MTEHEWLASSDPQAMLQHLQTGLLKTHERPGGVRVTTYHAPLPIATDRKLRLFACACVRQVWHLLTDKRSRNAVETAERFADGLATDEELRIASDAVLAADSVAVSDAASDAARATAWATAWATASDAARATAWWATAWTAAWTAASDAARETQADLLRDIFGNPFRHTQILAAIRCPSIQHQIDFGDDPLYKPICRQCGGTARRSWLTPTVKALAQAAYEERLTKKCDKCGKLGDKPGEYTPDDGWGTADKCKQCHGTGQLETGHLDPDRLLILADALEEAGCDSEEMLRHLRRCLSPHVRGCWVIDLLLEKE